MKCCRCGSKNEIIETEKEFICSKCFWKNYVTPLMNMPRESIKHTTAFD